MSKEATGLRIAVIGGAGDLGGRVARRLAAAGAAVCVSSRHARGPTRDGIEYAALHGWRWKAEEALRPSGLPYTIVRPSWRETGFEPATPWSRRAAG
jgi:uncharacterized protein YbjT (DUF2867 family)